MKIFSECKWKFIVIGAKIRSGKNLIVCKKNAILNGSESRPKAYFAKQRKISKKQQYKAKQRQTWNRK